MPTSRDVAVVIPCFRQAHFLPQALASLQAQSAPPAQVVVVDDGSPDDVAAAAAPFPGVRVVRQENRGLSAARNRGLAEVGGPYVVFLDADDRLLRPALEVLRTLLEAHPDAAFAWGFNRPFRDDGEAVPWGPTDFRGEPTYARLLEGNVVGSPLGVLFRREAVVAAGGFAEDLPACEDWELYLRLARTHAYRCAHRVIAEYRHHGANMSGDRDLMYRAAVEVLDRQSAWIGDDRELAAARARGRRDARRRFLVPARLDRWVEAVRARRWGRAAVQGAGLLLRHPDALIRTVLDRRRGK